MTDQNKITISQKNLKKLKMKVCLMMVLGIITFLSGFLKYTPFEHITLLLILLLAVGGVQLIYGVNNPEINGFAKFFLILTGISTMGFILLTAIAIVKTVLSNVSLSDNLELLEGLFYLASLIFLIGVTGSIICLNIKNK